MTRTLAFIISTASLRKRDFNIALCPASYHFCVSRNFTQSLM